jgi:large subunit ribosomal protein L1
MSTHSKRYREGRGKVENRRYALDEAVELLKSFPKTKFDQSVELHLNLGIDPKQSDQIVRGSLSLPAGIGKARKVVAFVPDNLVDEAKKAGATEAGSDDLVAKVMGGWADFDVAIAHPAMMSKVGKLGRVLGPQGKMPSPKAGTVTPDVVTAISEFAAGKVEFRNDDSGNVHCIVGKVSFEPAALKQNIEAFIGFVRKNRPVAAKGVYIKSITLTATMSPGVPLEVS